MRFQPLAKEFPGRPDVEGRPNMFAKGYPVSWVVPFVIPRLGRRLPDKDRVKRRFLAAEGVACRSF